MQLFLLYLHELNLPLCAITPQTTSDDRDEFHDVIQSIEKHTVEVEQPKKEPLVPVTQKLEKPGDIPESPEYEEITISE